MCLVLYLATDRPVTGFAEPNHGEVGLECGPALTPPALRGKAHVCVIADRWHGCWGCSCVFLDGEDPARAAAAYSRLRKIARAALKRDPEALLYAVWNGAEDKTPVETLAATPEDFAPGRRRFDSDDLDIRRLYRLIEGSDPR